MQWLTITERTEKRPVTTQSRDVVRDCRSIVNQLVNSMPKDALLRTLYTEHREATNVQTTEEVRVKSKSSVTRKFQLTEAKQLGQLIWRRDIRLVMRFRDRRGRLVRGVKFKAIKEQIFVLGVEKHHRQVGV